MTAAGRDEPLLIRRIRQGDADAWAELIRRYEGRLLAFVESRVGDRMTAEDLVQETFLGFLNSLPNYDGKRSLESWLFSIAAHKLTDHLRRVGRRPAVPMSGLGSNSSPWEPPGAGRGPSTVMGSRERRGIEEEVLAAAVQEQMARLKQGGEWLRAACMELLFLRGRPNNETAQLLGVDEQKVANWKFDFLNKLRAAVRRQNLPEELFPELRAAEGPATRRLGNRP